MGVGHAGLDVAGDLVDVTCCFARRGNWGCDDVNAVVVSGEAEVL